MLKCQPIVVLVITYNMKKNNKIINNNNGKQSHCMLNDPKDE